MYSATACFPHKYPSATLYTSYFQWIRYRGTTDLCCRSLDVVRVIQWKPMVPALINLPNISQRNMHLLPPSMPNETDGSSQK